MKYLSILIFVIVFQYNNLKAQTTRPQYCQCKIVGEDKKVNDRTDGVSAKANYEKEKLTIEILNNTKDTIFLFKSYFEEDICRSKYLYRYNKKNKEVKVSFLPLIPYLYTRYSHNIILKDRILEDYQTVYDFYKIPPFFKYVFDVKTLDLEKKKEYVTEIQIDSLNKFQKIKKPKRIKLKENTEPSYYIELAYYNDVSILCNEYSYFLDELNFNQKSKDYKKIRIPINIQND